MLRLPHFANGTHRQRSSIICSKQHLSQLVQNQSLNGVTARQASPIISSKQHQSHFGQSPFPNMVEADIGGVVVCWLLKVSAVCWCISGTGLLRELFCVDNSSMSNLLPNSQYTASPGIDSLTPGRVATRVIISKSLERLDRGNRGAIPCFPQDTTWPVRRRQICL